MPLLKIGGEDNNDNIHRVWLMQRRARSVMVGARVPEDMASQLRLIAETARRSVSDVVNFALDEFIADPEQFLHPTPRPKRGPHVPENADADELEQLVRENALILALQLCGVLMQDFISIFERYLKRTGSDETPIDFYGERDIQGVGDLTYAIAGDLMRNADWVIGRWFRGTEYDRQYVIDFLEDFTVAPSEAMDEYQRLLGKVERIKAILQQVRQQPGIPDHVQHEER